MTIKHTLTPWRAEGPYVFQGPDCIAICDTDNGSPELLAATAALIVRAVNAHDAMLAALENIAANLGNPLDNPRARWEDSLRRCAEAIALANGGA